MSIQPEVIQIIKQKSLPLDDQQTAIKANAILLDCLYRLSFTAGSLTAAQIDELVNSLQRKPDEIKVLLKRIVYIYGQAE